MKLCLALTLCVATAAGRTITYSGNDAKINGQMIWDHGVVANKFCAEKTGYSGSKMAGWDRCNHCVPGCRVCSGIGPGAKSCTGTIGTCWSFHSITCSLPDETVFTKGDAPKCHVNKAGATVVHYDSNVHVSFKCTHANNVCSCTAKHPTHTNCKEFDHTDGQTFTASGDCGTTGLRLVTDASGCTTGDGTTCEVVFKGCVMHHGTSKAYCKMPVSAEFKNKYEKACQHGGSLINEFAKPFANNHCTVIRRTIHGRGPDNINSKWKQMLDGVCKYHGDAAGVAGLSNLNGYFGTTTSPGRYTDEANCPAKGCGFAETSISSRESQCTSCTQGRYYKYWSTPATLACQGSSMLQTAPKKLVSLTTPAPTRPRTTCGSFSGADQTHCSGGQSLKNWPASQGGSRADCTSFCEAAGATCVVYQSRTQRCFCSTGTRTNGCRGCTARITFAAQCS